VAGASWLAWRRSPSTPAAVVVAAIALLIELAVQIPFLGFSILQLVFSAMAAALLLVAYHARRHGWGSAKHSTQD
jgi:hypothetical protein